MSFARHKGNLIDWVSFTSRETGREEDSRVLLLGEKEELSTFSERLTGRAGELSLGMEGASGRYDFLVIPRLTRAMLSGKGKEQRAVTSVDSGKPAAELLLSLLREYSVPGGELLLGVENADDADRIASGIFLEDVCYLKREEMGELENILLARFPKGRGRLYYPLPALEMPLAIYTEERLPGKGEADLKTEALLRLGCFRKQAPGFLYRFCTDAGFAGADERAETLYVKYNSSRRPEYAIRTELRLEADGRLRIRKAALGKEANAHIESLPGRAALLQEKNTGISVLREELLHRGEGESCSYIQYPFVHGKSLAALLSEEIREGRAPEERIEAAMRQILGKEEGMLQPANLDCLFSNILMESTLPEGGKAILIDCEWVQEEAAPVFFLRYRMLKYWYEEYESRLSYGSLENFLHRFGFVNTEILDCEKKERAFQERIHGEGERFNSWAYQENRLSLQGFERQKERLLRQEKQIEELRGELRERDLTLRKEREVQRLTNNHVGNLENLIRIHEHTIGEQQKSLAYLEKHQSLYSRLRRMAGRALNRYFPQGTRRRKLLFYGKKTLRHPLFMLRLYCTEEGRNRIRGDFRIGESYFTEGRLHFPEIKHPMVSIVIPCYNQIGYTYECLVSILKNTDAEKTPYEVIIADDVSTDATSELSEYAKGILIARNTENMGFLRNCNQAAEKASGKYILFLNNDTRVTAGWLSALTELIERDEGIGMVGSKLVYPDGRLQEAGGIIWSDGSGWNYGRFQDPEDPEYNYVRETDYISGAAIMIRATLWQEIGGFDERFAPAYCEDSDLAFEVRKHGKKVLYQPASVVVHYEGISNGTDIEGSGLKRYQLVNQEKFREKWREELTEQSVNDGNPNPFRARERGQRKRYVLVVDHYVPTFDKDAGSRTTYQYLQMLVQKGFQVKLLGDNFLREEPYTSVLQQLGIEVLYGQKMQRELWEWIDRNREMIDFVYLNRPHIAVKYLDYIRTHTRWKCIFYGHDLHFLRERREYELTGEQKALENSEYWKSLELSVMRKADISYYPSQVEIDAIHQIDPKIRAKAITAYVFREPAVRQQDYGKREGLLFVGGFAHPPNKDGVLWFANEVFPAVKRALPELCFRIVGSHADAEILALGERPGIEVLGFVPDERLRALYQESRIVVVPLRYGAGVKGKVVEALHEGAAILTTSCGAEGIPGVERALRIADTKEDFTEMLLRLYGDEGTLSGLSEEAVRFVEENFSLDGAWGRIEDDFSL